MEVISGRRPSSPVLYGNGNGDERDEPSRSRRGRHRQQQQPMYIVDWTWRLYSQGRAMHAADDAVLHNGAELDPAQVERVVRLALACCHPNPRERPSMRTAVQVLIGGAKAPEPPFHEPPFHKPAFVWPPSGGEPEIDRAAGCRVALHGRADNL